MWNTWIFQVKKFKSKYPIISQNFQIGSDGLWFWSHKSSSSASPSDCEFYSRFSSEYITSSENFTSASVRNSVPLPVRTEGHPLPVVAVDGLTEVEREGMQGYKSELDKASEFKTRVGLPGDLSVRNLAPSSPILWNTPVSPHDLAFSWKR